MKICIVILIGVFGVFFTHLCSAQTKDSCQLLWNKAYSYDRNWAWQEAFDTGKKVIETCPTYSKAYRAFDFTDNGIDQMTSDDTTRFRKYRYWLVSIIFLNKEEEFFCRCMKSILGTYRNSESGRFHNAGSSISKWMNDHHYCPEFEWHKLDSEFLESNHFAWLDSGTARHFPFDSTYSTMHELGLDFLDSLQMDVKSNEHVASMITSFSALINPFLRETIIEFTFSQSTLYQFAIYDVLGHLVWKNKEATFESGLHQIHLNGQTFPKGRLYARISTGFGEVKTIKLVHE
jgi:hypothetical protein